MSKLDAFWAGLSFMNLAGGFAGGMLFGGKVRAGLSAVLAKLADWVK